MTEAERARRYRDRRRGRPAHQPLPCGSPGNAGAVRHRRRGEPVDAACAEAERKYQRDNYAKRKRTT